MAEDTNSLMQAAELAVEHLTRPWRRLVRWAIAGVVLLIFVSAGLGYAFYQQHESDIRQCQSSNVQRANDERVLDTLVDLLLKGDKNPADIAEGAMYKQYIARVYAPRDCDGAYSITAPGVPSASPSKAAPGKGSSSASAAPGSARSVPGTPGKTPVSGGSQVSSGQSGAAPVIVNENAPATAPSSPAQTTPAPVQSLVGGILNPVTRTLTGILSAAGR